MGKKDMDVEESDRWLGKCSELLSEWGISIDHDKIRAKGRTDYMVMKRVWIVVILREMGLTSIEVGGVIKRNHSSVLHLISHYVPPLAWKERFELVRDGVIRRVREQGSTREIMFLEGKIRKIEAQILRLRLAAGTQEKKLKIG